MSEITVDGRQGSAGPSLLEQEIPLQPMVLERAQAAFAGPVAELMRQASKRSVDDWVVTGCGDSFFAGLCAEVWFARRARRRLRPVHAMQLSRETYHALSPTSLVFAVSHSGTTARVIEAARAARAQGAFLVAVTSDGASALAQSADLWIDNCVRAERSNCRTASFQAVSLFMRMVADALAAISGESHRPARVGELEPYVDESRQQVGRLADGVLTGDHWVFTGSGLGLAAAEYGKAKCYEAATVAAHCVELEQFVHCEIFTVRPETRVMMVASTGRASSRARELAGGLGELGAVTLAVTDDDQLAAAVDHAVLLPAGMHEDDLPFFAALPLQWMALRMALLRGEDPDRVANKSVNRPLIDDSVLWEPPGDGRNTLVQA
ncbi:MAG: SIS domain-containing protein [Euzebyales bacterium]|nr:SIS domain-containing protein [Euzebyales bacterium]